jgi:hypothetical protein
MMVAGYAIAPKMWALTGISFNALMCACNSIKEDAPE